MIKNKIVLFLILTTVIYSVACNHKIEIIDQSIEVNPFNKETFLINKVIRNGTGRDYSRNILICNVIDQSLKPVPNLWNGCINIELDRYDSIDFDDLIAEYKPVGKDLYEIGRFDAKKNQYQTLYKDTAFDSRLLYVSKKQNVVLYQNGIHEVPDQDVWIMDREGNHKKNITGGFKLQVFKCRSLDDTSYLIDGLSKYTYNDCFLFYNIKTEKLIVVSDKVKSYHFIDFYDDQILTKITDTNNNTIDVCLVDYNGTIQKTFYSIRDQAIHQDSFWLLDKNNHRLFYSYVTMRSNEYAYKIIEINLKTNSMKNLFTKIIPAEKPKYPSDYKSFLTLRYNKQKDCLQFITEKRRISSEETTLYGINLSTSKIETTLLPNIADYYFSNDDQFILCLDINNVRTDNKIFDINKKQLINLKEKVDIGPSVECFFSDLTNQFIISPIYLSYPDDYKITFVNIDGSVEQIQLPMDEKKSN